MQLNKKNKKNRIFYVSTQSAVRFPIGVSQILRYNIVRYHSYTYNL